VGDVAASWQRRALSVPACRQRHLRQLDAARRRALRAGGALWQQYPELAAYALKSWQIWNEPNKSKFWACKTNPKAYVELARVAAKAIHAVDPKATIITAGAPREGKPGTYLRKMFKNGAKKVSTPSPSTPTRRTPTRS